MDNNQGITIMEHLINLSMLAINTLIVKIISKIGGYQLAGTLEVAYDSDNHAIDIVYGGLHHQMVKLDKGVSPDQWAMDGRRNWRAIKRIADGIVSGKVEAGDVPKEAGNAELMERLRNLTAEIGRKNEIIDELTDDYKTLEAEYESMSEMFHDMEGRWTNSLHLVSYMTFFSRTMFYNWWNMEVKNPDYKMPDRTPLDLMRMNQAQWEIFLRNFVRDTIKRDKWFDKMKEEPKKAEEPKKKQQQQSKAKAKQPFRIANDVHFMAVIDAKGYSDIKRAHRAWMFAHHPDKNPDVDLDMVQAVNAYMSAKKAYFKMMAGQGKK